jgi:hypothetical protein
MFQIREAKSISSLLRPQVEIWRYLASDGCKIRSGETHVSSRESRIFYEFKVELGEF